MTFPLSLGAVLRTAQPLLSPLATLPQAKSGLLDKVALNPQPLPPRDSVARESMSLSQRLGQYLDEFCGTVPRRLPPPPPPPFGNLF